MHNVLFICTGNSARSLMAEVILNERGGENYLALSAGSHPTGVVNPAAIATLNERAHDVSELRSKSWDEFGHPDAPAFDYVITVCDNAASETCPVLTGTPRCLHWGIPDPAAVVGSDHDIRQAFIEAYEKLAQYIEGLLSSHE